MFFAFITQAIVATADSTGSRWVAPSTTEETKPFAALLVIKRADNATIDTIRLQPLSPDRLLRFAASGAGCSAASTPNPTAIIAWRGGSTDTSLVVCAQAGPEGADYLVARIARGGAPGLKEETIVSSAIAVGAGKKSTLSLALVTGLLGAGVTLVLFITQEWFKRWNEGKKEEATRAQNRLDEAKKREEDRKDLRLELSDKLMTLMVTEIRQNETKLIDFVDKNQAPVTLSISASQTVLGDTALIDYLKTEAKEGFAERWRKLFGQASAFNTSLATHEWKPDAERAASLESLRQEAKSLLSDFHEVSALLAR
jgi:hypothetical protein